MVQRRQYEGRDLAERAAALGRRTAWLLVDEVLEASVVGSFSAPGIRWRRRLGAGTPAFGRLPSQVGRTVLVTGATSGIGLEVARGLAALGAHVHLVGRDPAKAAAAEAAVRAAGDPEAVVHLADLADPEAVRALADEVAAGAGVLDAVIHAAGNLLPTRTVGPGGAEATVAVHLLAPFLLTELLRPALAGAASRPSGDRARVVLVTSGGLYTQAFDVRGLDLAPEDYRGALAYARAKRAQLVLTWALASALGPLGVTAHAVHPGWVDTPGLRSGLPGFARLLRPWLRRPEEGAEGIVWVATAPEPARCSGRLWLDHRARPAHRLPWTWVPARQSSQARALLAWCAAQPGWSPGPGWTSAI
jgi:NAD(P)-dependent dehydrogenase (short-subunit alcohol dehydrogenase family)